MKNEDSIRAWLDERRPTEAPADLAADVMRRIHARRHRRHRFCDLFAGLAEFVSARPLMRATAVVAGAGGGLVRIGFIVYALLF